MGKIVNNGAETFRLASLTFSLFTKSLEGDLFSAEPD